MYIFVFGFFCILYASGQQSKFFLFVKISRKGQISVLERFFKRKTNNTCLDVNYWTAGNYFVLLYYFVHLVFRVRGFESRLRPFFKRIFSEFNYTDTVFWWNWYNQKSAQYPNFWRWVRVIDVIIFRPHKWGRKIMIYDAFFLQILPKLHFIFYPWSEVHFPYCFPRQWVVGSNPSWCLKFFVFPSQ